MTTIRINQELRTRWKLEEATVHAESFPLAWLRYVGPSGEVVPARLDLIKQHVIDPVPAPVAVSRPKLREVSLFLLHELRARQARSTPADAVAPPDLSEEPVPLESVQVPRGEPSWDIEPDEKKQGSAG